MCLIFLNKKLYQNKLTDMSFGNVSVLSNLMTDDEDNEDTSLVCFHVLIQINIVEYYNKFYYETFFFRINLLKL